jgi:hypothetical protein
VATPLSAGIVGAGGTLVENHPRPGDCTAANGGDRVSAPHKIRQRARNRLATILALVRFQQIF